MKIGFSTPHNDTGPIEDYEYVSYPKGGFKGPYTINPNFFLKLRKIQPGSDYYSPYANYMFGIPSIIASHSWDLGFESQLRDVTYPPGFTGYIQSYLQIENGTLDTTPSIDSFNSDFLSALTSLNEGSEVSQEIVSKFFTVQSFIISLDIMGIGGGVYSIVTNNKNILCSISDIGNIEPTFNSQFQIFDASLYGDFLRLSIAYPTYGIEELELNNFEIKYAITYDILSEFEPESLEEYLLEASNNSFRNVKFKFSDRQFYKNTQDLNTYFNKNLASMLDSEEDQPEEDPPEEDPPNLVDVVYPYTSYSEISSLGSSLNASKIPNWFFENYSNNLSTNTPIMANFPSAEPSDNLLFKPRNGIVVNGLSDSLNSGEFEIEGEHSFGVLPLYLFKEEDQPEEDLFHYLEFTVAVPSIMRAFRYNESPAFIESEPPDPQFPGFLLSENSLRSVNSFLSYLPGSFQVKQVSSSSEYMTYEESRTRSVFTITHPPESEVGWSMIKRAAVNERAYGVGLVRIRLEIPCKGVVDNENILTCFGSYKIDAPEEDQPEMVSISPLELSITSGKLSSDQYPPFSYSGQYATPYFSQLAYSHFILTPYIYYSKKGINKKGF